MTQFSKNRFHILFALAMGLVWTWPMPSFANKPGDSLWYDFKFHGNKVGFLQAHDAQIQEQGKTLHYAYRRSVIVVRRQSHNMRIEAVTEAWSEPSGRPKRFVHRRVENNAQRVVTGERKGNKFLVVHRAGQTETKKAFNLADNVYLSSSLDFHVKRVLKSGQKISGQVIVEEDGALRPFKLTHKGQDKAGLIMVAASIASIESDEWLNSKGVVQRSVVPRLGAEFIQTTREKALVMGQTQDIFSDARLSSGTRLPPGNTLSKITLRLEGHSSKRPGVINDSRQKVKVNSKNTVTVTIESSVPPVRPAKLPMRKKRLKKFLLATPFESLSDKKLIAKSQEIVGKSKNSWTVAKKINAFVFAHIKDKSLAHAFSSATEALNSKEGDCTEHSVLFSALAKIAGIPTKLITGLVYVGGPEGIFGYHQWVEVWLGDRWVAMDPTFGQHVADPTHIKFTEGLSDSQGLRDAGIAAAELFGDMKIKILDYTRTNGKRVRP